MEDASGAQPKEALLASHAVAPRVGGYTDYGWDRVRDLVTQYPGTVWAVRMLKLAEDRVLQSGLQHELGNETGVTLPGFRMTLDLRELHDVRMLWKIRSGGLYEPETSRLLYDLVQPGDTFVDIGANNGYFTLLAASRVRPGGRVIAIEPNPAAFGRLTNNVRLNAFGRMVQPLPIAIGSAAGVATLFVNKFEDGWTSLFEHTETKDVIKVPIRSLDEMLGPVDSLVVKVDVEGSELAVVRGMMRTIRESRSLALIIEWNRGCASREYWDLLTSLFSVHAIVRIPNGYALAEVSTWNQIRGSFVTNLLCTRGPGYAGTRPRTPSPRARSGADYRPGPPEEPEDGREVHRAPPAPRGQNDVPRNWTGHDHR